MASAASTDPMRPRVSTIPSASDAMSRDSIIRSLMRRTVAVLCLVTCCVGAACSRPADEAPPVATPTVTLNRADAAVGSPIEMSYRFVVEPGASAPADDYLVFVHFLDT